MEKSPRVGKPVISYEYGGDDHDYDDHDKDNDDDDDNNDDNNVKDDDNIATCTEFWRQGHSLSWWQP